MSTALISAPFYATKDLSDPKDNINLNEFTTATSSPVSPLSTLVKNTLASVLNPNHVSSTSSYTALPSGRRSSYNLPKSQVNYDQQLELKNRASYSEGCTPSESTDTMKQNIGDTQSKPHLPAQISLVTNSMKPPVSSAEDGNVTHSNGTYATAATGDKVTCDESTDGNESSSPAAVVENELRLRRAASDHQDHKRNGSLDSIDLADVIKKQQQSLLNFASQHQQQQLHQVPPPPADTAKDLAVLTNKRPSGTINADIHYHIDGTTPQSKTPSDEMMDSSTIVQIVTGSPVSVADGEGNQPNGTVANPKEQWSDIKKLLAGVTLTILSAFCFSVTTVIVKFVTDIKPSEMALFRYIGILVLSFPVVMESKQSWFGDNNWWWRLWMFLRSVSGCTSLFFRYSAVTYISLADTTIIILSMPVFVFIFARIFLGEQFGRFHVLALFLSLVGIAFASKIEILFSKSHAAMNATTGLYTELYGNISSTTTAMTPLNSTVLPIEDTLSKSSRQLIGSLFALGAVVVGSLVYIMVRKMRKTHHSVILFNFALISIVEMAMINYIFYDFSLPTTGYSAYLVTILAVFSFYGQLLLTKAIQIEEAGVVSVVRVSGEAFFAFLFQIIIFGEMPDQYTIAGAILVLSSVFLLSYRKYVLSLREDAPLRKKFRWLTK